MNKSNRTLCSAALSVVRSGMFIGLVGMVLPVSIMAQPPMERPTVQIAGTPSTAPKPRNRYLVTVPIPVTVPPVTAPLPAATVLAPMTRKGQPPVSVRKDHSVKRDNVSIPMPALSYLSPNVAVLPPSVPIHGAVTQGTATQGAITQGIATLPKRPMSLAEVRSMAANNHPGVQQAARQAEVWRGSWVQAGLKQNPFVGYSAEEMIEDDAGKHGITYSQSITPKYKRNARQATIRREYQAAKQMYQIQCQKAINDALLAAYRVSFTYRKCLLWEELTYLSQESQRAGSALLQANEISRSMFLDLQIQSERTQIALRDAEIAYRAACKELAILLALPEEEWIEITDPVDHLPAELHSESLLAEMGACSPELRQAYAEVETAKARVRQECAEAGIDYDTNAAISYRSETKQGEFSVGVAVPLKIFDRNQGNIREAQSELAAARHNAERLERLIAKRYEQQLADYQTARNRVVSYKERILSEARESLNLALDAYRRGEYGSLELLDAQRTFSTVQVEYLDNMSNLMVSHVLLQGFLLSGGLEKPGAK